MCMYMNYFASKLRSGNLIPAAVLFQIQITKNIMLEIHLDTRSLLWVVAAPAHTHKAFLRATVKH